MDSENYSADKRPQKAARIAPNTVATIPFAKLNWLARVAAPVGVGLAVPEPVFDGEEPPVEEVPGADEASDPTGFSHLMFDGTVALFCKTTSVH